MLSTRIFRLIKICRLTWAMFCLLITNLNAVLEGLVLAVDPFTKDLSSSCRDNHTIAMLYSFKKLSDILTTIRHCETAVAVHQIIHKVTYVGSSIILKNHLTLSVFGSILKLTFVNITFCRLEIPTTMKKTLFIKFSSINVA